MIETRLDFLVNIDSDVSSIKCISDETLKLNVGSTFYGQFLLTILLSSILRKSRPSRILFMTSELHRYHYLKGIKSISNYCENSLATLFAAKVLSSRLMNSGVTCNTFSPGWCWEELEKIFGILEQFPS